MLARLALILAASLLLCGVTHTAEPPLEALDELLDTQLARAIHRALLQDKEFASYGLEVEVKQQVARLKGLVPNRDYADLAVARVKRAFPQLKAVQSELNFSGTVVLKPTLPETVQRNEKPTQAKATTIRIESLPGTPTPSNALPRAQTEGTPTRREVLAERVAAIQRHSSFAQVRVEIRGRKILVFRDDSTSELADLLAQRLRDLPGVEAVEILRGDSSR
ncbi:MAG: BON domain-containing protein [Gemmataceae bacterium]